MTTEVQIGRTDGTALPVTRHTWLTSREMVAAHA
jgi:hypothetical protein